MTSRVTRSRGASPGGQDSLSPASEPDSVGASPATRRRSRRAAAAVMCEQVGLGCLDSVGIGLGEMTVLLKPMHRHETDSGWAGRTDSVGARAWARAPGRPGGEAAAMAPCQPE